MVRIAALFTAGIRRVARRRGVRRAYAHEGRREQGWVYRLLDEELVQIETFSGNYVVMLYVQRRAIRHAFTDAEIAAANRRD